MMSGMESPSRRASRAHWVRAHRLALALPACGNSLRSTLTACASAKRDDGDKRAHQDAAPEPPQFCGARCWALLRYTERCDGHLMLVSQGISRSARAQGIEHALQGRCLCGGDTRFPRAACGRIELAFDLVWPTGHNPQRVHRSLTRQGLIQVCRGDAPLLLALAEWRMHVAQF